MLIKKITRTKQPITPRINYSNPITKGLIALVNGGPGMKGELVSNQQAWGFGSTSTATQSGMSVGAPANNSLGVYWDRRSNTATRGPESLFPTGPTITAMVVWHSFGYDTSKLLFGAGFGTASGWSLYSHFGDGTLMAILNDGSSRAVFGTAGQIKVGALNVAFLRSDASNLSSFINGVQAGTPVAVGGTAITYDASFSQLGLGDLTAPFGGGGGAQGAMHFGAIWNRALSDSEIIALSSNPWQLYSLVSVTYPISITPPSSFGVYKRKLTRTKQPNYTTPLNTSNPITRGLIFYATPYSKFSSIEEIRHGKYGKSIRNGLLASPPVRASAFNSTILVIDDYTGPDTTGLFWSSSSAYAYQDSVDEWPNYLGVSVGGPTSYGNINLLLISTSGSGAYVSLNVTDGVLPSYGSSLIRACTIDSTGIVNAWSNGKLKSTDSTTLVGQTFRDSYTAVLGPSMGSRYVGGTNPDSVTSQSLVLRWNRVLSDAEMASITLNPWQVFNNDTKYYPVDSNILAQTYGIYRKKKRINIQPKGLPRIDYSNPIARGLTMLIPGFIPGFTGDLVNPSVNYTRDGALYDNIYSKGRGVSTTYGGIYSDRNPGGKTQSSGLNHTIVFLGKVNPAVGSKTLVGTGNTIYGGIQINQNYSGPIDMVISIHTDIGNYTSGYTDSSGFGTGLHALTVDASNWTLYRAGVYVASGATPAGTTVAYDTTFGRSCILGSNISDTVPGIDGICEYGAAWNRTLSPAEIKSLSDNPYQLFVPGTFSYPVAVATVTVYKPSGDVTTTGWTSTAATLADAINETVFSDSSFITSPGINGSQAAAIMSLNATLPAGTWDISIRAKKSNNTHSLKVSLLDSSNTVLVSSSWLNLTDTYTTYVASLTNTSDATRIKLEVQ